MALSYYSDSEAFQQLNSDMSFLDPPQPELVGCLDDNFTFPDACCNIDYLLEPNDFFYFDENCNSLLPHFSSNELISAEPFSLQQEYLDHFHYSKRQKPNFDYEQLHSDRFKLNGFVPNPNVLTLQDYSFPEIIVPQLPDFPTAPPFYSGGVCDRSTKPPPRNSGSLSAQSIAARQRRRKITEKTQELGKLIPGGQKMNTAEMFQAAYKYIKFLQAQVGILEFMGSYDHQEIEETFQSEELSAFLESPVVQEKLYLAEKCLVPQKLVQELSSDQQMLKSKPQALMEIKELGKLI